MIGDCEDLRVSVLDEKDGSVSTIYAERINAAPTRLQQLGMKRRMADILFKEMPLLLLFLNERPLSEMLQNVGAERLDPHFAFP